MRGRLLLAFATIYVVWGSTYLAIAYAIESIPPLLMMGLRSLAAGAILYAWSRATGVARPARPAWRSAVIAGALLFLVGHGLLAWAEQRVATGVAALIVASGTVWMILVEWAWPGGRRPAKTALAGAALGMVGVALLVAGNGAAVDVLGAAALTVSALSWAIGSLYGRKSALPSSPALATGMQLLAGGALLVAASAVTGEARGFAPSALDARSVWALLYLTVFGSVAAFTAYVWLMRVCSPVQVSTHNFVNPTIAVLLGWLLAGEVLTPRVLLAGAVIVLAILLIRRARIRRETTPREVPGAPSAPRVPVFSEPRRRTA